MASLSSPLPRPRTHSSQSSNSGGPYVPAYLSPPGEDTISRKRTSQTFRPSPLAGPALSYVSFSAIGPVPSSQDSSPSSSLESSGNGTSDTDPGLHDSKSRMDSTLTATLRSASTGALPTVSRSKSLQPPKPILRSNTSKSAFVNTGMTPTPRSSKSAPSTPTLSSLISLSISETPHPHGDHYCDSHESQPHVLGCLPSDKDAQRLYSYSSSSLSSAASTTPPTRRLSRLSFAPLPSIPPMISPSSGSLRSSTSNSSLRSAPPGRPTGSIRDESGAKLERVDSNGRAMETRNGEDYDSNLAEKHRPSLAAQKHDWLVATPTPVFTRSDLRTQKVIMPISARERHKMQSSIGSRGSIGQEQDKEEGKKGSLDVANPGTGPEKNGSSIPSEEAGVAKLGRRATQRSLLSRIPSLSRSRSSKHLRSEKTTDAVVAKHKRGGSNVRDASSIPPVPPLPLPNINLPSPSPAYAADGRPPSRRVSMDSSSGSSYSTSPDARIPDKLEEITVRPKASKPEAKASSSSFTGILRRLTVRQRT